MLCVYFVYVVICNMIRAHVHFHILDITITYQYV